jgi:hypothetical protein
MDEVMEEADGMEVDSRETEFSREMFVDVLESIRRVSN